VTWKQNTFCDITAARYSSHVSERSTELLNLLPCALPEGQREMALTQFCNPVRYMRKLVVSGTNRHNCGYPSKNISKRNHNAIFHSDPYFKETGELEDWRA
jgi:hypothetical protein